MSNLPYSIELHDSLVSEMLQSEGLLLIKLSPAYVHRDGKGWSQDAVVEIGHAEVSGAISVFPCVLDDGALRTNDGPYHNLLELPLSCLGPVRMKLEFQSGETVSIVGSGINIRMLGEPKFIEDFAAS